MNNIPKQGDIYRHYKGNLYIVLLIAKHTETEENMVIYRSIDHNKPIWARPLSMWNETVQHEGKTVSRFKKIDPMRCNYCDHYEGVHKVQGVAPCLKHNRMTLWSDLCDDFINNKEE